MKNPVDEKFKEFFEEANIMDEGGMDVGRVKELGEEILALTVEDEPMVVLETLGKVHTAFIAIGLQKLEDEIEEVAVRNNIRCLIEASFMSNFHEVLNLMSRAHGTGTSPSDVIKQVMDALFTRKGGRTSV